MSEASDLLTEVARITGHDPRDPALFTAALTHGSMGSTADYQRLEFLGDRVLGLTIADALYRRYPAEPEGKLSSRFNALVARETCAAVARDLGLPALVQLGKQAREDGARHSDNIAADVVEAVIGALHIDAGPDVARAFVMTHWSSRIDGQTAAPRHPKSELQEWAAAQNRRVPEYELTARDGPPHAPRFTVTARIGRLAEATGEGSSKHAAETAAAAALLTILKDKRS